MAERWNLPALHAMLAVSLPVSACSLLRRAYPHGGTVELASSARDVGSQFVSQRMLAQIVRAARASFSRHPMIYYPEGAFLHPNGRAA